MRTSRNLWLLGMSFLLIFFGFDGFQQYITMYLRSLGTAHIGFLSLLLVYVAFMVGSLPAASIVARFGAKRCMVAAVGPYALYGFSLLTESPAAILGASIVLGAAAAVLWVAQSAYLVRASSTATYGADAGRFATMFSVGAASGILILGILLPHAGYRIGLATFATVPLLALILLTRLDDLRGDVQRRNWNAAFRMLHSPSALRIAMIWFPFNCIQGFVLGVVPLRIQDVFGTTLAVGTLVGLFYLTPIVTAYALGALSDRIGRRGLTLVTFPLGIAGIGLLAIATSPVLLVIAITILALNFGLARTLTFALVGDVTTDATLDAFSALTWFVQSVALTIAFALPLILNGDALFLTAAALIAATYVGYHPIRRTPHADIRRRIAEDTAR
ncbi:MAG: MFS transporter [bacterium]|nr:MFS transporter [bacterium]